MLPDEERWDVEQIELSPGRELLAYTTNVDGSSRLRVLDLCELTSLSLPPVPDGVIEQLAFTASGSRLGFSLESADAPAEVYSIDFDRRGDGVLTPWTRRLADERVNGFARATVHRVPTFDGTVPAFVYLPRGPGPHPVLIDVHGGPADQSRPRFSYAIQYFVNRLGIAVVAPNVRGSLGYGNRYVKADDGLLREDAIRDIGALLDWIDVRDELDASRVAVGGGSYGGYVSLASLARYPDRFAAGIARAGISDFVTYLENTSAYRADLRRVEYGDERDPEMRAFLELIAPIRHVGRMTKPMLITQGRNDPRVPVAQSDRLVHALQARDVPVWYVLANDEGHGFRRKANRDYLMQATALFLEKYLVGSGNDESAN